MSNSSVDISAVVKLIKNNDSFLVVSHISPDGDTIGSAAAFCEMLKLLGKKCVHVCDGMPSHNILKFDALMKHFGEPCVCGVAVAIDCADILRLGKYKADFENSKATLVIDHHKTNCGFGDVNYIRSYPACAQCIFEIIDELNIAVTKDIAQCLYVAFLTDTGRFAYKGVGVDTMQYVARLYDFDIDISGINRELYCVKSFAKTKLIAKALDNLEMWYNGKVSAIFIDHNEYQAFMDSDCDTEGIVNYALDVEGCQIAIFAYEKCHGVTKVSFRSLSSEFDVAAIASNFGGGGHTLAAGCTVEMNCEETKKLIRSFLQKYN